MRRLFFAASLLLVSSLPALAKSSDDRVTVGSDVTVAEGESVGDIACVFCTIRVHGDVKGDIAVMFGTISVDAGRNVGGDVAALGADLNLGVDATVGGDVALAGGDANLANGASIHGSRMVLPNRLWVLLPFAPLLILIGVIWLIIYFVRRNRYEFPQYPPQGRRF
jgi:hypothetical protein